MTTQLSGVLGFQKFLPVIHDLNHAMLVIKVMQFSYSTATLIIDKIITNSILKL